MLFFGSRAMTTTNSSDERIHWPAKGLTAVVDFAVASHARAVVVLMVVALAAFLPGFFQLPPIDRDEARFAQATKQMVESGDYVDIRFQDEVRYKKPVGIYWLQAAVVNSADMLGLPQARSTIWLYRVPSLLGALGAVLLTYWTALAFVSRRAALLAGLMLATSILLGVEARLAKTDAMLLATILAAMGALARVYLDARLESACNLLDRLGGGDPAQRTVDPDDCRSDRGNAGGARPLGALAVGVAVASRSRVAHCAGAALVPRHCGPQRR
jgi:4-amino-4-deoxy-L-arabinose transferase-like glycosyltransferase